MYRLVLSPVQASDNDCASRFLRYQVLDSAENLRLFHLLCCLMDRMGLPSVGSAEVITMTGTFPAIDLQPHILNSFSLEKVLITPLYINA
jgi:hypothetical protein